MGEPFVVAPCWETAVFQTLGMGIAPALFQYFGWGTPLGYGIGAAWATFGFAFAHVIGNWFVRAKEHAWGNVRTRPAFLEDAKDTARYSVPAVLFSGVYTLALHAILFFVPGAGILAQIIASLITVEVHSDWNIVFDFLRQRGRTPGWMRMASVAGDSSQAGVWQRLMLHLMKTQIASDDKAVLRSVLDALSTNPEARAVLAPLKDVVEGVRGAEAGILNKAAEFLQPRVLGYGLVTEILETVGIGVAKFHENEIVRQANTVLWEHGIVFRIRFLHDIAGQATVPGIARSELESFAGFTARDESGFQKGVVAILLHRKVLDNAVSAAGTPEKAVKFLVISALRQFFISMGSSEKVLDETGIRWNAEAEKTEGEPLEYYIGSSGVGRNFANIKGYPLTPGGEKRVVTEQPWPIAMGETTEKEREMADLVTWVGINLRVFRELNNFKHHQRIRQAASDSEEKPARKVIREGRELLKLLDPEPATSRETGRDEMEGAKTVHEFANDVHVALFDLLPERETDKSAELWKVVQARDELAFTSIVSISDADSWNSLIKVFEGYRTQLQDTYFLTSMYGEKKEAAMALATVARWLCRIKDLVREGKILYLLYNIHTILKDMIMIAEVYGDLIHFVKYLTGELADPETRLVYEKYVFPYMEQRKKQEAETKDLKEKRPAVKPTGTDPLWEQALSPPAGPRGTNFIYGNYFAKLDLNAMMLYVPRGDWYNDNPFAIAALLAYVVEVVRASDPGDLKDVVQALRKIENRLEERYKQANSGQSLPASWVRLSVILGRTQGSNKASGTAGRVSKNDMERQKREEQRAKTQQLQAEGKFLVMEGRTPHPSIAADGSAAPEPIHQPADETEGALTYRDIGILLGESLRGGSDVLFVSGRVYQDIEDWAKDFPDVRDELQEIKSIIRKAGEPYAAEPSGVHVALCNDPRIFILAVYTNAIHTLGYLLGNQDEKDKDKVRFILRLSHVFTQDGVEESIGKDIPRMVGLFEAGAAEAQKREIKKIEISYLPHFRLTHRDEKSEAELYEAFAEALSSRGFKVRRQDPGVLGEPALLTIDVSQGKTGGTRFELLEESAN